MPKLEITQKHSVTAADATPRERAREPSAALFGLAPGPSNRAVDDGEAFRVDGSGAAQERDRRQRDVVRVVLVEAEIVGGAHSSIVTDRLGRE